MTPAIAETVYVDFITSSPTTGAATDADSLPTCEVFEEATDTTMYAPTIAKRTGKTGNYRATIACTGANGFEAGKSYNVVASATVGTVVAKAVIQTFMVRTNDIDDVAAKTANLPVDPADASDIAASFATVNATLATLSGYVDTEVAAILAAVDTEVAAIKAKTDQLVFTVANRVDATAQTLTISAGDLTAIADAILKRDFSAVSGESARSLLNAARFLRNKFSISGTTLTVTREDDATPAWVSTLTTDAAAIPIVASDPI